MKRLCGRWLALLFLFLWLPAGALALTGQNISTFLTYYKDDLTYINELTDRHMLPIELDVTDLNDNGRKQYSASSEALRVTVSADATGIIESCEIRLTYPEGAQQGNSLHLEYVTANYHSLAFIMAMHVSSAAESRFYLVEEIRKALIDNHGAYERQLGSYSISCVSVAGEGAVFTFTNNGLFPTENAPPDEQQTPEPLDDSERFG